MYKIKKTVSTILVFVCIFSICLISFASSENEPNRLSENPPSNSFSGDIQPHGPNPPSKDASVHDLSTGSYKYEATDMGYRLYTNKWLTGSRSIYISVSGWELLKYDGGTGNKLTLRIFDASSKEVASKTITIDNWDSGGSGSASFSGLSESSKYYVCFEVPTNGNRYAFNGSISKP